MSLGELLDHTCEVYHIKRTDSSPGYGLPSSPSFSYGSTPDLAGVPCHFGVKAGTITVVQKEPQAVYEAKIKLTLPIGTDIRLNDKIVHCETGYEYTADIPRDVRDHHMVVYLQRKSKQAAL